MFLLSINYIHITHVWLKYRFGEDPRKNANKKLTHIGEKMTQYMLKIIPLSHSFHIIWILFYTAETINIALVNWIFRFTSSFRVFCIRQRKDMEYLGRLFSYIVSRIQFTCSFVGFPIRNTLLGRERERECKVRNTASRHERNFNFPFMHSIQYLVCCQVQFTTSVLVSPTNMTR